MYIICKIEENNYIPIEPKCFFIYLRLPIIFSFPRNGPISKFDFKKNNKKIDNLKFIYFDIKKKFED